MTDASTRTSLALGIAVLLGSWATLARAEPPNACKPGTLQTLTGVVTIAASKEDSVGGWMIVAPTLDDANPCKVMDFIGKGLVPEHCGENAHFKATGTVDADSYALQVTKIECR